MFAQTVKFARRAGIILGAVIGLGSVAYAVFFEPIIETAADAKSIAQKAVDKLERHIETEMPLIYRMSGQLDAISVHFGLKEPRPPVTVPMPVFVEVYRD